MVHPAHPIASSYSAASPLPRIEIHAERGPQTLARIIGIFAAQNLMPADVLARQSCGGMWIGLHIDVEQRHAERLAEKLRSLVCVDAVVLVAGAGDESVRSEGGSLGAACLVPPGS
jgi:hypothetical protein